MRPLLALVAREFPYARFHAFSDCAFVACEVSKADGLLQILRTTFASWSANGILVRGGIARGEYRENESWVLEMAPPNFVGSMFYGAGATRAVREEGNGLAALLFVTLDAAAYYIEHWGEKVYGITETHRFIPWSDSLGSLSNYVSICTFRLAIAIQNNLPAAVIARIRDSLNFTMGSLEDDTIHDQLLALMYAIINDDEIPVDVRRKVRDELGFPENLDLLKPIADAWVENKEFLVTKTIAGMDTSLSP